MKKTRMILAAAVALAAIVVVGVVSAQQKMYQLSPLLLSRKRSV